MGSLDPDDSRPPYRQVTEAIRRQITDGELAPGAKLPSHAALADEYGVSVGTVKRAFGVLQADGLVVTRQGQGAFVRTTAAPSAPAAPSTRVGEVDELWRAVADLRERLEAVEDRLHGQ